MLANWPSDWPVKVLDKESNVCTPPIKTLWFMTIDNVHGLHKIVKNDNTWWTIVPTPFGCELGYYRVACSHVACCSRDNSIIIIITTEVDLSIKMPLYLSHSLRMPIPSPTVHSAVGLDLPAFPQNGQSNSSRSQFNLTVNTIQCCKK